MSVTRRLYLARIVSASLVCAASSSVMFLFHMLRSSIHFRPKSCAATKQTWSKSCEISSLMTDTLKGQLARAVRGRPAIAPIAPTPARNVRRESGMCISLIVKRGALSARIGLGFSGAGIQHGKSAVGGSDHLEPGAVCAAFEIGNRFVVAVVRGVGVLGGVEHVEVFEAGAFMHGLPCLGAAGLVRTVVHNSYARMNRIDECARVGEVHAVMVYEKEIDV